MLLKCRYSEFWSLNGNKVHIQFSFLSLNYFSKLDIVSDGATKLEFIWNESTYFSQKLICCLFYLLLCLCLGLESCFCCFLRCVSWTQSGSSCSSSTGPLETLLWRSCCVTCSKTESVCSHLLVLTTGGHISALYIFIRGSARCSFFKGHFIVLLFPHQVALENAFQLHSLSVCIILRCWFVCDVTHFCLCCVLLWKKLFIRWTLSWYTLSLIIVILVFIL